MLSIAFATLISFVFSVILTLILIPVLRTIKFGQEIRECGPESHKSKAGTPTMGGIGFILAMGFSLLFFRLDLRGYVVFLFALLCGAVGFVDDYIKVCLKRNEGFNVKQKTACLLLVIVAFVVASQYLRLTDTRVYFPFFDTVVDFSYFYYPLIIIGIFYVVNSVNLTDGIDGLAGSVSTIVLVFLSVTMYMQSYAGLSLISAAGVGALIGFLVFNIHPAKVFMGDTGSLFLGGLVTGIAVSVGNPFMIVLFGMVYIIEALSVVIQVTSFKLTGKRIFKMSPIHHHFELSGFSENKVVILFSAATLVFCVIGFFGIVNL